MIPTKQIKRLKGKKQARIWMIDSYKIKSLGKGSDLGKTRDSRKKKSKNQYGFCVASSLIRIDLWAASRQPSLCLRSLLVLHRAWAPDGRGRATQPGLRGMGTRAATPWRGRGSAEWPSTGRTGTGRDHGHRDLRAQPARSAFRETYPRERKRKNFR